VRGPLTITGIHKMSIMREEGENGNAIGENGNAIGETTALRWEPTHITKHSPRNIPLQWTLKSMGTLDDANPTRLSK